ncbi:MAG: hypothetical protein RR505_10210, partial [Raoultibacter sp.]
PVILFLVLFLGTWVGGALPRPPRATMGNISRHGILTKGVCAAFFEGGNASGTPVLLLGME